MLPTLLRPRWRTCCAASIATTCPPARRARPPGEGDAAELRSFLALPPHQHAAQDGPAVDEALVHHRAPLAGPAPGDRLGLPAPDRRQEPPQPAHEGTGLRLPRRGGQ